VTDAYYELVELLGEGGMGRVYRAVHHPTRMEVAIKTLRANADALRRRLLLDEATAAARVRDKRVARVIDVGRDASDAPFLVMELVPGHDLERFFVAWPGWPTVARAMMETLEGLRAAHAVQVVHRDLKPPNVLVDSRDQGIRLVDFGVATIVDPIAEDAERHIAGTPEFMPPEQISGEGPVGPFTDLYAFGVMLCHVVRGASPFKEMEDLPRLDAEKRSYVAGRDRRERDGLSVPEELQALIDRLLDPAPRRRERFAERVRSEIERLAPLVVETERVSDPGVYHAAKTSVDPSFEATALPSPSAVLSMETSELDPVVLPAPMDPNAAFALAATRDAPFAGRHDAQAELLASIDRVVNEGGARLIAYVGEPGIGKSRLARLGLESVERSGTMEGAATGFDARGADVSGGLFRLLARWLGIPRSARIGWAWLEGTGIDLDRTHRWLAATSMESAERPSITEVVDIAHGVIRALSKRAPVYLWLDDLAWARDGAIELVERLLAKQDARVLVVATLRSGTLQHDATRVRLAPMLASPGAITRVLEPLDREERRAVLYKLAPLAPALVDEMVDRLDGSPMLLVEVVRALASGDLLESRPEGLAPRGNASLMDLLGDRPLATLIGARVEAMLAGFESEAGVAEGILSRAALLGAFFEDPTLRACVASDRTLAKAVDAVLDRALLHGIVRAEGASLFSFDHQLVQETLMMRLEASPNRVRVYFDVANGLMARHGKDRSDVAAAVADLLRRAGAKDRAWDRMLHAIETAAWAGDRTSAQSYLSTAHSWLDEDAETAMSRARATVALAEARARYYALEYDAARIALSRALSIARVGKDALLVLQCESFEADVAFYQDRFSDAERIARACEARASMDDPDLAAIGASAAQRLADLAVLAERHDVAIACWERCYRFRLAAGLPWRARIARMNLAESLMVVGRLDEAGAVLHEVHAEADAARDDEGSGCCVDLEARLAYLRGDPEGARIVMSARGQAVTATGDPWRRTMLLGFLALLSAKLDGDDEARASARAFTTAYARVPHDEAFTIFAMRLLVERLGARGLGDASAEVAAAVAMREERVRRGTRV
jgi:hypothetical protein